MKSGIINVYKEAGYTSFDVVAKLRGILHIKKIGHTGTLDPDATGVLPLLIGKATLISKYLINHDKTYIATLKLGIKTDTADGEGKVLEQEDIESLNISKEKVANVLENIIGKQEQYPPMYSAIKVNGKKLYDYARNGQTVEIRPRNIEIYNTELINYDPKNSEVEFEISCSKGTYIRTVCENIAERLKTIGYMKELHRVQVGDFSIQRSYTLDELKSKNESIEEKLLSIEELFKNKEDIKLDNKQLQLFLNGVKLKQEQKDDIYRIYNNNIFIGLGVLEAKRLKRDVII